MGDEESGDGSETVSVMKKKQKQKSMIGIGAASPRTTGIINYYQNQYYRLCVPMPSQLLWKAFSHAAFTA